MLPAAAITVVDVTVNEDAFAKKQTSSLPRRGRVREGAFSDVISTRYKTSSLLTSPRLGEEITFCESINQGHRAGIVE